MYSYKYPRAALTVDSIVFTKEQNQLYILLIQRGIEPYKNCWALPGGFVNIDERLEDACIRELEEETGLKVASMKQFKAFDDINRDPRHRTISVVFSAALKNRKEVKGNDDAVKAKWFLVSNLPELAFDHKKILVEFFQL